MGENWKNGSGMSGNGQCPVGIYRKILTGPWSHCAKDEVYLETYEKNSVEDNHQQLRQLVAAAAHHACC